MSASSYLELLVFFLVLLALSPVLGSLFARVLDDEGPLKLPGLERLNAGCLRLIGRAAEGSMTWGRYAVALLLFNGVGLVVVLAIQLLQAYLPGNPQGLPAVPFWLALNTAVSFVTNTNWQAYSGEATLSYFSQAAALTVQNFVSAATGIAVMTALARGLVREKSTGLGNFWRDLTRTTVYILLPLSALLALTLVGQGVVQSFAPYVKAQTLTGAEQVLPLGPAASQIAIKQLGTNGGGFFGVNSAHPFENPTPLSNFLQLLAILLIPASLPFTFGKLTKNPKHGLVLFFSMAALFLLSFGTALWSETQTNPALGQLPFLEGKEVRIGLASSVLWGSATTVASNGSVNSMLSSFSPVAGGLSLLNIMLGEVVFGGVGSGVYGMVLFVILTVFLAGLMVGRTPEYLGKKVETSEVRMAAIGVVLPSAFILIFTAIAIVFPAGLSSVLSKGPHGLSEVLYAFSSGAGNNGSAFAGLNANTPFYNGLIAIAMLMGRYGVILPVLFISGSLARKKTIPASTGTFPSEGLLFSFLLCAIVLIVGGLTFFPALSLGPILEHLLMRQGTTF